MSGWPKTKKMSNRDQLKEKIKEKAGEKLQEKLGDVRIGCLQGGQTLEFDRPGSQTNEFLELKWSDFGTGPFSEFCFKHRRTLTGKMSQTPQISLMQRKRFWIAVIVVAISYFGFCPAPENAESFGSTIWTFS